MQDCIVINFHPFALKQDITLIKGGKITNFSIIASDVVSTTRNLAKENGITEIQMHGNSDYLEQFKNELMINNMFEGQTLNVSFI